MTRFGIDNEKYTCVYGVDHQMGRFLQIYRAQPTRMEDDVPLVDIDELTGVKLLWSEDHGQDLEPEDYEAAVRTLVTNHLRPEAWAAIARIDRNFLMAMHTTNPPDRYQLEVDDLLGVLRALDFSEPMLALVRGAFVP